MSQTPSQRTVASVLRGAAYVSATYLIGYTLLYVAAVRQEQREKAERERVRWTDKNRWE
jgi:hypothetical protein